MKIRRTIPPAAAPVGMRRLLHGAAGFFCGDKYKKKLEEELKEYFGFRHVFPVSSGKAALFLILTALGHLSPGKKKVLAPAYTCYSVPSSIVKAGLDITLCDMDAAAFDFDYALLGPRIEDDTLCIIATHLFGIPPDIGKIREAAGSKKIYIIEDAAQAMGAAGPRNEPAAARGDVGFFSFGRGKNITCGSGGVIFTGSDEIAGEVDRLYRDLRPAGPLEDLADYAGTVLMSIFIHPSLYWLPAGLPFLRLGETFFHTGFTVKKLSGMKAGLLAGWQPALERSNRFRAENARYYRMGGGDIAYLRYPVVFGSRSKRDEVYRRSCMLGLGASLPYPAPVSDIPRIKEGFRAEAFPSARLIVERMLFFPTHELLSRKDKKEIRDLLQ
ncbi:MAG: DegT/DnrJ/EryC1/StrS family aminotransferase [Nitrospiraceae bacterium]|nr:DegT/DnrJ/EryC1/StrS family aminotransferase [Nitrospiraceae bacterium]